MLKINKKLMDTKYEIVTIIVTLVIISINNYNTNKYYTFYFSEYIRYEQILYRIPELYHYEYMIQRYSSIIYFVS